MVADAIMYHPTVTHYLKLVGTTGMLFPFPSTHSGVAPALTTALVLPAPKSAATSSCGRCSTSPASMYGTSCG